MCCCTDLALESRDYDLLFGRIDAITGLRSQGLLDQFNNPHIDSTVIKTAPNFRLTCEISSILKRKFLLQVIAMNVAEQLVNKGLFEDAITMYDIAGVSTVPLSVRNTVFAVISILHH